MLTFIEAISLAGDRSKQNDDALGFAGRCGWVIDGATDLHDAPLSGWRSDAAWLAHQANADLYFRTGTARALDHDELAILIEEASKEVAGKFFALPEPLALKGHVDIWKEPIASLLLAVESPTGILGADLGDCRLFALGDDGTAHVIGGPDAAADAEAHLAAQQADAHKPLLQRESTIARLRTMRAALNRAGAEWTFGLNPACADHARYWQIEFARPAHMLLMTDGFAALVDRYRAYDAAGLVRAALDKGLHELGRELRAIEAADAGGARHPRFKASDDATALLMRLS